MALYLVVHVPGSEDEPTLRPPTRLREMADESIRGERMPRWLKTWSPDLHDDRLFTLWEAASGDEIKAALKEFGFLDEMDASPLRVREWGPEDVLASE